MTRTRYRCPACKSKLVVQEDRAEGLPFWWAFCPFGPCPSATSNEGAWAPTAMEAVKLIQETVEIEMGAIDWREVMKP